MKILLTLLLTILPSLALALQCEARGEVSSSQFEVITRAYTIGEPHNLGYSMAAIVWKESSAGKVLINTSEHSYGPFQINLRTAMRRAGGEFNAFRKNQLATQLLDLEFSSAFAIKELEYWISVHGENWLKVWASYNGGWSHDKPAPRLYALDIAAKIQQLKGCFEVQNNDQQSPRQDRHGAIPVFTFR